MQVTERVNTLCYTLVIAEWRDVFEAPLITVKSFSQIHVDPFDALQVLVAHQVLAVDPAAAVAGREEVAVALEVGLDQDDEQVDAILDRQDPEGRAVQTQNPSVVVRAEASAEVVLEEAERLWVGKVPYIRQIADVADAEDVDAGVAAGPVAQQ